MNRYRNDEAGTALLGAVLVTVIVSMLGTVSLNLGAHEIAQVKGAADEAVVQSLAEAGSNLVMQWFHDPSSAPNGTAANLLAKRFDTPESGPSFFDSSGKSQFGGTRDNPDVLYDASRTTDDRILNDPADGWFRSLHSLGRILTLKVYGPSRPGLLCTVEVTAGAKGLTRALTVQLSSSSIPPLRASVQVGNMDATTPLDARFPVWVHWGSLKLKGDGRLGRREELPAQSQLAPVTGQSYAEMSVREDRWFEMFVGGEVLFAPSSSSLGPPTNVYPHQEPAPGLHQDHWNYQAMKKYAILFGTYYARDHDGMLYRNGVIQPGLGVTPHEVFTSRYVGDHRGLVFIDTLDQLPPRPDNLGHISVNTEYAEGLFIVNAHLHLQTTGLGKSMPALSPPSQGSTSLGTRIPIELPGMHVQGVLYTAGDFSFVGQPRVYGAVVVEGSLMPLSPAATPIEVWYNYSLRSGLFRGLPVVHVAPGTWQQK